MDNSRAESIVRHVMEHPGVSSSEIINGFGLDISPATMRRDRVSLVADNKLVTQRQKEQEKYF